MRQETTPGNYATHAQEAILNYVARMSAKAEQDPVNAPKFRRDIAMVSAIAKAIAASTKFILPTDGKLVEAVPFTEELLRNLRLPFKTIGLEMEMAKPTKQPAHAHSNNAVWISKKLITCVELERDGVEGFMVYTCVYVQDGWNFRLQENRRGWIMIPFAAFVPYTPKTLMMTKDSIEKQFGGYAVGQVVQGDQETVMAMEADLITILPVNVQRTMETNNVDMKTLIAQANIEANEDVSVIVQFLNVLACSNVETTTIPASKKLQAKRQRSGKLPMYEYKILTIKPGQSYGHRGGEISPTGQTRRQHVRRGHFRTFTADRYKAMKGKRVWIQSHVVGDEERGVIHKDYRVEGQ